MATTAPSPLRPGRDLTGRVAALLPSHHHPPEPSLLEGVASFVGRVLLVDDHSPPESARALRRRATGVGADVIRLAGARGKGSAIRAGLRWLRARPAPPAAVLVLDADGQHPPWVIPRLLAAACGAELVVGDRLGDRAAMPWERRVANVAASGLLAAAARRRVRDSQCGMRVLAGRALWDVSFPAGGYEAETLHLKRCLRAGLAVSWVPIPALYEGQVSSYRPLVDSLRILLALGRR
jgi:Glycosyl transferase family 2